MYSKEIRQQVLKNIKEGKSVKELSEVYNISIPTIYKWKKENSVDVVNCANDVSFNISMPEVSKQLCTLMEKGCYSKALEICEKYKYNPNIQSQHAKILFDLGLDDEALKICDSFPDNFNVQQEKIKILINLERYDEAYELCCNPDFKKCKVIQDLKSKVVQYLKLRSSKLGNDIKESFDEEVSLNSQTVDKDTLNKIYTKIYLDDISLSEIEESNISDFHKVILKVLYYEKYKLPNILFIIKNALKIYSNDKEKSNILIKLYRRFESKKNSILDYSIYSEYLECYLSLDLIKEYNDRKLQEFKLAEVYIRPINITKPVQESYNKPVESIKLKTITEKNMIKSNKKPKLELSKTLETSSLKKKKSSIDISNLKIQNIFSKEVEEIKIYLYVEMNKTKDKRVIELFDRFCILVEKSIIDEQSLLKFIDFAIYIDKVSSFTSIDLKKLEAKRLKYIKPSN